MKEKIFKGLAKLTTKRPGLSLLVALVLTILAGGVSEHLELKMNFKDLMPQSHPTVVEYNKILDHYQAASNVVIAAIGEEDSLKRFVEDVVPEIKNMGQYIKRVDYKMNKDFFENHAFILTKSKDLANAQDMYSDLGLVPFLSGINDAFEKTYVADGEESISNKEKEDKAVASMDGLKTWLETMQYYIENPDSNNRELAEQAVDKMLIGEEYFLSQNKDMILLFAQPTFPVDELDKATPLIHSLDSLLSVKAAQNSGVKMAGTTGTMALAVQETDAASQDMMGTSLLAFVLIIILFIISFRMWTSPILAGISLVTGIVWTTGFVAVTIGSLNMMTSMFAVILIGLGIDFNIHIISAYNQLRADGLDAKSSIYEAFMKSGNGILIGALTTALAFLTMIVARNSGMKEFGVVAGVGVLLCMVSSLYVLPSLLIMHEKIRSRKTARLQKRLAKTEKNSPVYNRLTKKISKNTTVKTTEYTIMGKISQQVAKRPVFYLSVVVAITIAASYMASHIGFNYDYLSMEPVGLKCVAIQDSMLKKFDVTPDVVMVTAESVEQAREIAEKAKDLKKTGMVTTISDFIPNKKQQDERIPYINKIRQDVLSDKASVLDLNEEQELEDELYRFEDNIIELAQLAFTGGQDRVDKKAKEITGNLNMSANKRKSLVGKLVTLIEDNPEAGIAALKKFQEDYERTLRQKLLLMCSTDELTLASLPKDIVDQFASDNGKSFMVSIYPKEQVWDLTFLKLFSEQMHKIDERVTGMPLVFYILLTYIGRDGAIAAILTMIVIFLLLLIDYRNLKLTLLTLIPLVGGIIWMVGVMKLFGIQFNILNVMAVPLILGMGIDDGVHIIHRYKIEGKNKIFTIFSTTGKAVLLTSITTFLAFGSLGFASARGLASLGIVLAIGIVTCLLATVIVLPAIISLIDSRK
jgi:uncharacterized protein